MPLAGGVFIDDAAFSPDTRCSPAARAGPRGVRRLARRKVSEKEPSTL
jgi:hypothetical protein